MEILELKTISEQKVWMEKIRLCDWGAAKLLADLIEQDKFHELLGVGSLFIMADGEKLVSFCTLTQRDCIKDDTLFPWIGFVFTAPEYRGNRYSGKLIEYACNKAKEQDYKKVYIATDHIGLYEKYGFTYIESRTDIYGEEARIYLKNLKV
jgi:N-acetylglutamate synthase-like GNAT family acetyltransferase